MTTYNNTKTTDSQIEEQGLQELRDAYMNYMDMSEDYWALRDIRDKMDTFHPLFPDANKRYSEAKKATAGAAVLFDLMCTERVAKQLKEADDS